MWHVRAAPGHDRWMPHDDLEFLGLSVDLPSRSATLTVDDRLCTPWGYLYGGTGVAACAAVAEVVTGRPAVWVTTQYISHAHEHDAIEVSVDEVVRGRLTSQTQVRGTIGDRLVFTATAAHSERPADDIGQWGTMPDVSPPDDGEPFDMSGVADPGNSFLSLIDRRVAPESKDAGADGRVYVWSRIQGWPVGSATSQGFIADIVPVAFVYAFDRQPGGTSLDNTIRVVNTDPVDDWILLDVEAEGFTRSVGHGRVRLWRRDGTLIGVGSQSAIIRTSHLTRYGHNG